NALFRARRHMRNVLWTGSLAIVCVATIGLAAQDSLQTSATQRSSSSNDKITVTGCIAAATPSTTGTTGSTAGAASSADSKYVLNNAMMGSGASSTSSTSTTGTAGTPSASSSGRTYRLDADDSKLSPHVGHKVEISGTLEAASGSSSSATSPTGATASAS